MNRDVEERIVAMYFDNEDFEKNAKTTIDTLGQLKNGLNMEESGKGFQVFEKIGKTLNFDKATKGLEKIKSNLNGMGNVFKKIFNIGPIDEAARAVETFKNRYLNRVIGFDLAHSIVNAVEGAFRSLTIQPITAGWSQYQTKMDSVKTIMSSTGESIEVVETHLQKLTDYANKTIYNLSDMTSNLGKFTNNGMKLDDSVKAMQGIANAAADAGQGAAQASMAMYNISQAMGVGKMTTIDWKSIENANMATQRLKNTFIEMAAAQGDLQKEFDQTDQKYHYYVTKNSKGETEKDRKKWTEVTAKNFRETLSKDWLTSTSMMHALMVYSGEAIDPDTIKSWGITDPELIASLEKIGKDALEAATQVRTFSKMMDALKEAAQSGWATTFELIFGNMEQGTTLWTEINGILDEILSKSADARNEMLKVWSGSTESVEQDTADLEDKNSELAALEKHLAELEAAGDVEGTAAKVAKLRDEIAQYKAEIAELRKSGNSEDNRSKIERREKEIRRLEEEARQLETKNRSNKQNAQSFERAEELEKEIDGYNQEIKALKDAEEAEKKSNLETSENRKREIAEKERLITELEKQSDGDQEAIKSQIDGYKKEIKELQDAEYIDTKNAEKTSQDRMKLITEKEKLIKRLQDQADKLNKQSGRDEIEDTRKKIELLKKEIGELEGTIDEKKNKPKSEFVDEQGRSGRDILFDRETGALFRLIDLAKELGSAFSEAFHNIFGTMDAEKLFNMTRDFGKAVENIVAWFGKANEEGSRMNQIKRGLQGIFAIGKSILNLFKMGFNLAKKLIAPVADVVLDLFGRLGDFFSGFGEMNPVEMFQKIGDGLKTVWDRVKKFFSPQDIRDDKGVKTGETRIPIITWLENVWNGLKKTVREWANESGLGEVYASVSSVWNTISTALNDSWTAVKTVWEEVRQWFIDSGISAFFTNAYDAVVNYFTPKEETKYNGSMLETKYQDSQFVTDLKGIGTFFKNIWEGEDGNGGIKNWSGWKEIATFFTDAYSAIVTYFAPTEVTQYNGSMLETKYQDSQFVTDLKGIGTFFKNIWEGEDGQSGIKNWKGWEEIVSFFTDTYNAIATYFTPTTSVGENGVTSYQDSQFVTDLKGIGTFFKNIWEGEDGNGGIKNWSGWKEIATFFTDAYSAIVTYFAPTEVTRYNGSMLETKYQDSQFVRDLKGIRDFFVKLWEGEDGNGGIKNWPGWTEIARFFTDIGAWVMSLFNDPSKETGVGDVVENVANIGEELTDAAEKANADPEKVEETVGFFQGILNAISGFINDVVTAIKDAVIPPEVNTFLTNLWEFLGGMFKVLGDLMGSLGKWMKGEELNWHDTWNIRLAGIFTGIGTLLKMLSAKWYSGISGSSALTSIGGSLLAFGAGILMISGAVALLTTVDPERLQDAFWKVAAIMMAIGAFGIVVAQSKANKVDTMSDKVERILTKLIDKAAIVLIVKFIVDALPPIIKAVGEAKSITNNASLGDDLIKTAEAAVILFGGIAVITGIIGLISKLVGNKGIDFATVGKILLSVIEVFAGISVVVLAVGGIAEAIEGTFANGHEGVLNAIDKAGDFFEHLSSALGKFFKGFLGNFWDTRTSLEQTEDAMEQADMMAEFAQHFDNRKMSGLSRMLTMISQFSSDTMRVDTEKLAKFSEAMGALGDGISEFALSVVDLEGPLLELSNPESVMMQKLKGFLGIGKDIGDVLSSFVSVLDYSRTDKYSVLGLYDYDYKRTGFQVLTDALDSFVNSDSVDKFVRDVSKLITKLSVDLPNDTNGIQFDGLAIVTKLFDAIQDGLNSTEDLPEFDATSIVDAIVLALTAGDTAIANIVHSMVQTGLDLSAGGDQNGATPDIPQYTIPGITDADSESQEGLNNLLNLFGSGDTKGMEALIGNMEGVLGENGSLTGIFSSFSDNIPDLNSIMEGKGWGDMGSLFSTQDEEGNDVDILSLLQEEMGKVTETLNQNPITVTITPVFDMTHMTKDGLQKALDKQLAGNPILAGMKFNNPTESIDIGKLGVELGIADVRQKLELILEALERADSNNGIYIGNLGNNINGISNSISGMKMVLDSGVLVAQLLPMIDAGLGQRGLLFERTGVVFTRP